VSAGTLAAIAAKAGVTRVADLTGLDRLDIPVAQAVRPMGKSLSTSMGKGLDFNAARVGAMMEAIEVYCAEEVPSNEILLDRTCDDGGAWLDAEDLVSGEQAKVPGYSVSLDYTRPDHLLRATSNGLASGSNTIEALRAAVSELIERDRWTKWLRLEPQQKAETRVCIETVEDAHCRTLFAKIRDAGCALLLWHVSEPEHLPVYAAAILDKYRSCDSLLPAFGTAARFDPAAAVIAAVGEAAQTRAAIIAGARDDRGSEGYTSPDMSHGKVLLETFGFVPATRRFVETRVGGTRNAEEDLAWLLDKLTVAGTGQILWIDLFRDDLCVPVVKVIAPSLEGFSSDLTAWRRAR
jgi:ribosomal protein S12 methylthiotransferase accessory factor